jgi:hypothetical protein
VEATDAGALWVGERAADGDRAMAVGLHHWWRESMMRQMRMSKAGSTVKNREQAIIIVVVALIESIKQWRGNRYINIKRFVVRNVKPLMPKLKYIS